LRRRKGPAVPERDLQNMDGQKIDWRHILSNYDDARDQLFLIFPSGKTGTQGVLVSLICFIDPLTNKSI